MNKLLTVEAEQKQKGGDCRGGSELPSKRRADGDAYATVKNATANAEALRVQATAITANPAKFWELKRIEVEMAKAQNWKGVRQPSAVYAGAPIPFFNVAGGH